MARNYYVYNMASRSGCINTGVTNNIRARALEHKVGIGGVFTSKNRCKRLVYYETGTNILQAIAREKDIKGWRRSKKVALTNSINPSWKDLVTYWYGREIGM